jgi:hypothetical protein
MPMMGAQAVADARGKAGIAAALCLAPILATLGVAFADAGIRESLVGACPLLLRYGLVMLLPALLLWALARALGRSAPAASILALAGIIAFIAYAGMAQSAAYALLVAVGLVVGSLLYPTPGRSGSVAFTAMLGGVGVIAGLVGWLLPMPLHSAVAYLIAAILVLVAGRHRLREAGRPMLEGWSNAVAEQPLAAGFAVAIIGLAAVPSWLPTLNPDDNAAHLLMARDLLAGSYYRIDASSQVFAVAPWLNNVLHAMTTVLAGAEARSVIGLGWLLAGCVGAYRVAHLLGARGAFPWLAAALYASHPLTAYFGMTLQVDGASTAVLLHLVASCIELKRDGAWSASPWLIGALCGMLAGLKISNGVYLLVLGSWLIWHHASSRQYRRLALLLAFAGVIAGSSYFYATVITGNPLFPLFNGIFKSPYMAAIDFSDPRWHVGVGIDTFWKLTFSTPSFMESYIGARRAEHAGLARRVGGVRGFGRLASGTDRVRAGDGPGRVPAGPVPALHLPGDGLAGDAGGRGVVRPTVATCGSGVPGGPGPGPVRLDPHHQLDPDGRRGGTAAQGRPARGRPRGADVRARACVGAQPGCGGSRLLPVVRGYLDVLCRPRAGQIAGDRLLRSAHERTCEQGSGRSHGGGLERRHRAHRFHPRRIPPRAGQAGPACRAGVAWIRDA